MSKEPDQPETTESREEQKGRRVEYLYQTSPDFSVYPLLGSLIRALGKEWNVAVYPTIDNRGVFEDIRERLKDSSVIQIEPSLGTRRIQTKRTIPTDLVLIDSSHHPKVIKRIRDALLGSSHVMVAGQDSSRADYDLISDFSYEHLNPTGVIAITGNGKGKSTSAFGIGVEAVARGEKVAIVQWFKEAKGPRGTWSINEHYFPDTLHDQSLMEFYATGSGFYGSPNWDRIKGEEAYQQHKAKAQKGVELAKELIASRKYKVVVLDELVDTLAEVSRNIPQSLLTVATVRELLAFATAFPETRLVVTGRRVTTEWEDLIKDSYVINEIRHPWSSKGKFAISGLDF